MTKNQNESSTTTVDPEIVKEAQKFLREHKDLKVQSYNYTSPRISSEIPDCALPLTFDQYNFCSLGCIYCCLEGTSVSTERGRRRIQDLQVGETVFSKNVNTGEVCRDNISSTMERIVDEIFEIELENGQVVSLTGEHPVYVKGFGWKEVHYLQRQDDVDFSKRPDQICRMQNNNPMKRAEVAKKQSKTMSDGFALGRFEELREKLRIAGAENLRKFNKKDSTRKAVSERMKNDNPMKRKEVADKMAITMKRKFRDGEITPFWLGKEKPDAVIRMKNDNPMQDPEIRKKTLQKIVKSWVANRKVSEGEVNVKQSLRGLGYNFIHQFTVAGPKREYIMDFFLPDYNICIEYDGHSRHYTEEGIQHDSIRDNWLNEQFGIETIRVKRDEAFVGPMNLYEIISGRIPNEN